MIRNGDDEYENDYSCYALTRLCKKKSQTSQAASKIRTTNTQHGKATDEGGNVNDDVHHHAVAADDEDDEHDETEERRRRATFLTKVTSTVSNKGIE